MIHPIFYLILCYLFVGLIATHLANTNVTAATSKKRWIKVGIYVLITFSIVCSILYFPSFFLLFSLLIIGLGLKEVLDLQKLREAIFKTTFGQISVVVYLILASLFLSFIFQFKDKPDYLLYWFVLVFTFDSFSQLSGQLFGKQPLFPKTSPNKTVEGLIGGLLFALGTAFLIHYWTDMTRLNSLILGFLISIGSLIGDYLASFYKRKYSVKDFNELIPAHGGILDRFDSFIFSGAVLGLLSIFHLLEF